MINQATSVSPLAISPRILSKKNLLDDLLICGLFFSVFKSWVLPSIPQVIFKLVIVFFVFLRLVIGARKSLYNFSAIFALLLSISSLLGWRLGYISTSNFLNGILYSLLIYEIFSFTYFYISSYTRARYTKALLWLTGFYCVVSLVSICATPQVGDFVFFFGPKFMTTYYFVFFLGLFYFCHYEKISRTLLYKSYFGLLFLAVLILLVAIKCTTVYLSMILVAVAFLFMRNCKFLHSPLFAIGLMLFSFSFVFWISSVLNASFVRKFIEDVLHETATLSDRTRIYSILPSVLTNAGLFGFGYNNAAIFLTTEWASNAQNGLADFYVDFGLAGTLALILLTFSSLYNAYRYRSKKTIGLLFVFYSLIIVSFVEIGINYIFFFLLAIIGSLERRKEC